MVCSRLTVGLSSCTSRCSALRLGLGLLTAFSACVERLLEAGALGRLRRVCSGWPLVAQAGAGHGLGEVEGLERDVHRDSGGRSLRACGQDRRQRRRPKARTDGPFAGLLAHGARPPASNNRSFGPHRPPDRSSRTPHGQRPRPQRPHAARARRRSRAASLAHAGAHASCSCGDRRRGAGRRGRGDDAVEQRGRLQGAVRQPVRQGRRRDHRPAVADERALPLRRRRRRDPGAGRPGARRAPEAGRGRPAQGQRSSASS